MNPKPSKKGIQKKIRCTTVCAERLPMEKLGAWRRECLQALLTKFLCFCTMHFQGMPLMSLMLIQKHMHWIYCEIVLCKYIKKYSMYIFIGIGDGVLLLHMNSWVTIWDLQYASTMSGYCSWNIQKRTCKIHLTEQYIFEQNNLWSGQRIVWQSTLFHAVQGRC